MHASLALARQPGHESHELLFESLFHAGRGLAFPCDAHGNVDLDGLSERGRENYFFARAVVGFEYRFPCVRLSAND